MRFSKKKPVFDGKMWRVIVEIGAKKKEEEFCFYAGPNAVSVETTDCLISVAHTDLPAITMNVHDWVSKAIDNEPDSYTVHYIGKTSFPHRRPLNGEHNGLSRLQGKTNDTGDDIFIFYNVFQTLVLAESDNSPLSVVSPNSKSQTLASQAEAEFIEKCFIKYFDCDHQWKKKEKEVAELHNSLEKLLKSLNVRSVIIRYHPEGDGFKYIFGSSSVPHCPTHLFEWPEGVSKKGSILDGIDTFKA